MSSVFYTTCFVFYIFNIPHSLATLNDTSTLNGTEGCSGPELSLKGVKVARPRADYSSLAEVKFSAVIQTPFGPANRICKIKCVDKAWLGPLCQQTSDDGTVRFQPLLRSCDIDRIPPHLVITFENTTIQVPTRSFPHNSEIQARCRQPVGLYKLLGEPTVTCNNGLWSSRLPSCIPTTVLTNYTEDSPPTILVRIPSGSGSEETNGVLAVYPGSIVHLECLYPRAQGNPEWSWTPTFRSYLTGWAISPEERDWKYRLSMYYSKPQDSGVFTCSSPRGLTNSISLQISDVHCNAGKAEPILPGKAHSEGTRLGQAVIYTCPHGYNINGTNKVICRANGRWSNPVPKCEPIKCPKIDLPDKMLNMTPHNSTYGSRVVFSCPWGYKLNGSPGIECLVSSNWSHMPPKCLPIRCPSPVIPKNGRVIEDASEGDYRVGAVVQFSCTTGYRLQGEQSIVCTDAGFWSHPPPFCVAVCEYPGEPINGRVIPLKFSYEPGDRLKVTCHPGFVTKLDTTPECLPSGNWSDPLPICHNYTDV